MATILYVGTHGAVDPTRGTLPFVLAGGALKEGHEPQIALLTEAVYLITREVVSQIKAVGFPPLGELLPQLIEHKVSIYV